MIGKREDGTGNPETVASPVSFDYAQATSLIKMKI